MVKNTSSHYRSGGFLTSQEYLATPLPPFLRTKSSWLASIFPTPLFTPVGLHGEGVRANSEFVAKWTLHAARGVGEEIVEDTGGAEGCLVGC